MIGPLVLKLLLYSVLELKSFCLVTMNEIFCTFPNDIQIEHIFYFVRQITADLNNSILML
jgi:hypothetical protein